jgi:hypothetical protein
MLTCLRSSGVRVAKATSMGLSMVGDLSTISSVTAAIRPPSRRYDHPGPQATADTWFLAFYLIGLAKTGISSLDLSRHLRVQYDTAWLLHTKILLAKTEWQDAYLARGKIQMDDAYLGGEVSGGNPGRGSENKIPTAGADSLNEAGHPSHARITVLSGFRSEAILDWAKRYPAPGSPVLSDGLSCFSAVTAANCHHKVIVTGGKRPNELLQFRWINILLGNLKTSFSGAFYAFIIDKCASRYLGVNCSRFIRRFLMVGITTRIANAVCY